MTRFIKSFVLAVCLASMAPMAHAHNIHSSMTNVQWNESDNSLEFILTLHGHELEAMLSHLTGRKLSFLDQKDDPVLQNAMRSYVQERLSLVIEEEPVALDFVGHEVQGQIVTVYMETALDNAPAQFSLNNSILLDAFDDQVNTIVVRIGDKRLTGDITLSSGPAHFNFVSE